MNLIHVTRKIKDRSFSFLCMHARCVQFILPSMKNHWSMYRVRFPVIVLSNMYFDHYFKGLLNSFLTPSIFFFFFFVFFLIWWWWFCFYLTLSSDNKYCVWVMACTCIYCDRGKIMNRWHIIKEIFVFYLPFYWVQI